MKAEPASACGRPGLAAAAAPAAACWLGAPRGCRPLALRWASIGSQPARGGPGCSRRPALRCRCRAQEPPSPGCHISSRCTGLLQRQPGRQARERAARPGMAPSPLHTHHAVQARQRRVQVAAWRKRPGQAGLPSSWRRACWRARSMRRGDRRLWARPAVQTSSHWTDIAPPPRRAAQAHLSERPPPRPSPPALRPA